MMLFLLLNLMAGVIYIHAELSTEMLNFENCLCKDKQWLNCSHASVRVAPSCHQLIYNYRLTSNKNLTSLQCYKVTDIDLSHNRIARIERNALSGFPAVKVIALDYNEIEFIHESAFTAFKQLQILRLSHNKLLSSYLISDSLMHLDMSSCLIEDVQLSHLPKLKSVNLDYNRIGMLKRRSFVSNDQLRIVRLSNNKIESIERSTFWMLENLTFVDLSNNEIRELPEDVFNMEGNWISVDLSFNHLHNIDLVTRINSLNLSCNRIHFVDPFLLQQMPMLETLDLSNNHIQSWPSMYSERLHILYLHNNNINFLGDDSFYVS